MSISIDLAPLLNRVHKGDSLALMKEWPKRSVDLIVTSPPYNLRNTTGGGLSWKNNNRWAGLHENKYETHDDAMPHSEYVEWQRECLSAMMEIIKDDGAIFYNHKWRIQDGILQDRADIVKGFPVRQVIIWQRAGGINFNPNYFLPTYEVIYLIAKPAFRLRPGGNKIGDVWRIPQEQGNPHPAPFPIKLAMNCIGATKAEVVLDPFLGSGNTAIAADKLGRDWIGVDISQEYCTMANDRITKAGCALFDNIYDQQRTRTLA